MKGRAFVFGDEINTDYIAPAGFSTDHLVENLMEPIRPGFHEEIEDGDVIVAGEHFGSGSSRETAPRAIQEAGVAAVVAESFSRLYYRNSVNIGLPPVTAPGVTDAVEDGDVVEIDWDASTVRNLRTERTVEFEAISDELLSIFEAGGILEYYEDHPEGLKGR